MLKIFKNKKVSDKIGEIGLFIALILAVPKMILGAITGSISLISDGVNNLMDSFVSLMTIVGLSLSKKPRDKDHPYGHSRIEYIIGFLIAIITAVVGIEFFKKSVESLINPSPVKINTISRIFLILSIVLKSYFSLLNHMFYKSLKSTIFKANRQDALFDVIISVSILISSFFFENNPRLDALMALIISLILLYSAYTTIKDTMSPLIGEAPSKEDLETIYNELNKEDFVSSIHNVYIDRKSMDHVFATADVEVDENMTVREAHDKIEKIVHDIKFHENIDLVVHIEPKISDPERKKIKELALTVDGVVGVHDILLGNPTFVTISINCDDLDKRREIQNKVLEKLKEIDDRRWIIDKVVSFKEEN